MRRVGIIGVGLLGSALAERLLQAGFTVVGFDVDPMRRDDLLRIGGTAAESARDVAASCDRLLLSLPQSDVAAAVIDDVLPRLSAGAIVIDTTTGDPNVMRACGGRLAERGIDYLDATVAGSSRQAREGDVVIMAGGTRQAFEACADIFAAVARESVHVGECGSGARMKLVVNLVLGLNRAVLAEGLAFARSLGFEPADALKLLKSTAAYSRAMDVKGEKMIARDFAPEARLSQHLKDVRLMLDTAARNGRSLPLSQRHAELLSNVETAGYGGEDNSAVFRAFD